jgi:hypothetical protein
MRSRAMTATSIGGGAFLSAQRAEIAGRVTDASGALVPDDTITVRNTDAGIVRTTVLNAEGNYAALSF